MADHKDCYAPAQERLQDLRKYPLEPRVQPFGWLVQQVEILSDGLFHSGT